MDYANTPTVQLVARHNELLDLLSSDAPRLKVWKQKKTALIDKIEALEFDLPDEKVEDPIPPVFSTDISEESGGIPRLDIFDPSEYEEFRGETIRETSLKLLCHVERIDTTDNRSVGLTYEDIEKTVRHLFPDGKTSVACLRWYAVKVRADEKGYEDWVLPQKRPRSNKGRAKK
jgi:hypothetical protein